MNTHRLPYGLAVLAALALVLAGIGTADGSFERLAELVKRRQYQAAVDAADKVAGDKRDLALFLKGNALLESGKAREALAAWDELLSRYPASPWKNKAVFRKADAHVVLKEFDKACRLYEGRLKELTGGPRRQKLAEVYQELGDAAAKPKEKEKTPDWAKAIEYYGKALEVGGLPDALSARLEVALAAARYQRDGGGDREQALTALEQVLAQRAAAVPAIVPETRFWLAGCYAAAGRRWEARAQYYLLVRLEEKSGFSVKGAHELVKLYGFPTPGTRQDLALGGAVVDQMTQRFPQDKLTQEALLWKSQALTRWGERRAAAESLVAFLANWPEAEQASEAAYALGILYLEGSQPDKAREEFSRFLSRYPASARWQDAQKRLIDIDHADGKRAWDRKAWRDCVDAWGRFLKRYPLDERGPETAYQIGKAWAELKEWKKAIETWSELAQKHPSSPWAGSAWLSAAETYADKLFDFDKAFECCAKPTDWRARQAAGALVARIKSEALAVKTPRVFGAAEKPELALELRNVEKLRVKVYRIDLGVYFRKIHSVGSIEKLDVDLINPDREFTHEVPAYAKYRPFAYRLPLAENAPGAYVVQCTTDKLQATTLVVVSDLGLVVKAGPGRCYAFASSLKDGAPAAGVDIVVSNGKEFFLSGKTGADGVFAWEAAGRADGATLSVFASRDGHVAACAPGLVDSFTGALGEAFSYLATDKPAYRPGDTMRFKVLARWRTQGRYETWLAPVHVSFRTPAGLPIDLGTFRFNEYGTLSGETVIDSAVSPGNARLTVTATNGVTLASHDVQVAAYEAKDTEVSFAPDKPVYFPGEKASVRVSITRLFGSPAAEAHFLYRVQQDGWKAGRCDKDGKALIEFDTARYAEAAEIALRVKPAWAEREEATSLPLLKTEYAVQLSTVRAVYVPGESVPVSVRVLANPGVARKRELRLRAFRVHEGVEKQVADKLVATDEEGKALARFEVDGPGAWRVLVEGATRTGETASAGLSLSVPAADDARKLFLLYDATEFAQDGPAEIRVHSRLGACRALLTIERDRVLERRWIDLPTGNSTLRVEMRPELYPNFRLSLAVATREGFAEAAADFRARRALDVKVELAPASDAYAPGQEVELALAAVDQRGRGTQSELFIAVVDDALWSAVAVERPEIGAVFGRAYTFVPLKSASFTPFSYAATTAARDQDLVQENERRLRDSAASRSARGPADRLGEGRRYRNGNNRDMDDESRSEKKEDGRMNDMLRSQKSKPQEFNFAQQKKQQEQERQARLELSGLAFYKSELVTDGAGKARVRFKLPERPTRWRVVVVAAGRDARFGAAERTFPARKERFLRLEGPLSLNAGDRASLVGQLYNLSSSDARGSLRVRVGSSERAVAYDVKAGAVFEFPVEAVADSASADGTVRVTLAAEGDELVRELPVRPAVTTLGVGDGGAASSTVRLSPTLPDLGAATARRLTVRVAPPATALLEQLAGALGPWSSQLARTAAELLRLVARYEYQGLVAPAGAERLALAAELKQVLLHARVLQAQNWDKDAPVLEDLALLFVATGAAKKAGIKIEDTFAAALKEGLNQAFSSAPDNETKALVLFALSWEGDASYAYLNRLYRLRDNLANRELALLTAACANADRRDMAAPLADQLERRFKVDGGLASLPGTILKRADWFCGRAGHTALGTLALQLAKPASPLVAQGIAWLLRERRGHAWDTPAETGLAAWTVARHLLAAPGKDSYRVRVIVNDETVGEALAGEAKVFAVPARLVKAGRNSVVLDADGRGRFLWSVSLEQDLPGFREPAERYGGALKTGYRWPSYNVGDKTFERGQGVTAESYSLPTPELTNVAAGMAFPVDTDVNTYGSDDKRAYVVVHELPAGCRLLEKTITDGVRYWERRGNSVTFWLKAGYESFRFWLAAETPGTYVVPPIVAYPASQPWQRQQSAARRLVVAPRGTDIWKHYVMTPDELYKVGEHMFKEKRYDQARALLESLVGKYKLSADPYRETALMLLAIHIARADSREIVKWFEVLKERYPDLTVPFDQAEAAAKAYMQIGEWERGHQLVAGIVESYFIQEAALSGAYQAEKRVKDSAAFMERLFLEYPDQNEQRTTFYALGQQLYARAVEAKAEELKELGVDKAWLLDRALDVFERCLLLYPGSQSAPEAAFSILTLYVEREQYALAVARAREFAAVYRESAFLDSFDWLAAYALFFDKRFAEAADTCRRVATTQYRNAAGEPAPSKHRDYATHMLGKVHHSLQRYGDALLEYAKVTGQFTDAARAIEFLKLKRVSIPEVSVFGADEPARLRIQYKGVQKVQLTVYKVDFLILCLKEKNLSSITRVNLAGIKPLLEREIELSPTLPYLTEYKDVEMPVSGKGAYLVVLKSGELEGSGMIVKSDILIDVLEIRDGGTARVALRERKGGKPVSGAVVKFIGTGDKSFQTATTDLRGMAEVSGLNGLSTIVGMADGHYCFFRGTTALGAGGGRDQRENEEGGDYKTKAKEGLMKYRYDIQQKNKQTWEENIRKQKRGVDMNQLK